MLQLLFDEESSDSSCGRREIYSDMAGHEKPVITPITGFFIFAQRAKPARVSVFRGENQKFSPAPIDPQRLLKSPPSGRASPVSIACAEVILDL